MITFVLPSKCEPKVQRTIQQIEELAMKLHMPDIQIIISNDREGKGKGWAVRQTLPYATRPLICFLDADGDIEPRMVKRLIPFLDDYDVVVGVKPISGRWDRRILTYLSRIYIAILFNIRVDSQTGIKLFKREALAGANWYSNGWLFDIEILHDCKEAGYRMIEVPIEADVSRGIKGKSLWRTFKESLTLWLETR